MLIANANVQEMSIFAHQIHITLIPPSSYGEILRAWKRRCQEIKCPDHGITARLSTSDHN
ncbi:MAG: hypothetical protein NTX72_00125 [Candidatus Uhrbacteria bacterium]|nr:hypothetical protein [Candidatus Uhrbacteria bacterium]